MAKFERLPGVDVEEAFEDALKQNGIEVKKDGKPPKHHYVVDEGEVYELYSDFTIKKRPVRTLIRKICMFFKR